MCRHIAYLGEPVTLHSLIYEPPHSLEHQSYAPKLNRFNKLNADGFGVGWYEGERVIRYRRASPMWHDKSFADVATAVSSGCIVAAVRSATSAFPIDESCAQPLRCDGRLFSHNGRVDTFTGVEAKLRELAGDLSTITDARGPFDSALLFAITVNAWRAGASLADGLAHTVATVTGLTGGRYNLLASDGSGLAATAWGDSLFVRRLPSAVVIASEPYDEDPAWERVPDRSLVTASPDQGIHIQPLT